MRSVISLGAGVQSTALYVCAELGLYGVPRADFAVFADVGDEPAWVYEQVERLRAWGTIPIHTATAGQLSHEIGRRLRGERRSIATIPAFTDKGNGKVGILPRNCTRDFKIRPISRKIREVYGLPRGGRVKIGVQQLLGISTDEADRMKPSRVKWLTTAFPLIEANLSRTDCLRIVEDAGLGTPRKSACVFCPYHGDAAWADLKTNHPDEFAKAVAFDAMIRDSRAARIEFPVYLHRSLQPLAEVTFSQSRDTFSNECAGVCGV